MSKEIKERYSIVVERSAIDAQNEMAKELSKKRKEFEDNGTLNINDVEGHAKKVTSSTIVRQGMKLMNHFYEQGLFDKEDFEIVLRDTFYK